MPCEKFETTALNEIVAYLHISEINIVGLSSVVRYGLYTVESVPSILLQS